MATSDWFSEVLANSNGIAVVEDQGAGASQNGLTKGSLHTTVDSGSITIAPAKSSTANTPAIASSATALAANTSRKSWSIQNLGTNALFVRLGASASITVFHFILLGGIANDDGRGAIVTDDVWQGIVSVAGTSPRYTVSELT